MASRDGWCNIKNGYSFPALRTTHFYCIRTNFVQTQQIAGQTFSEQGNCSFPNTFVRPRTHPSPDKMAGQCKMPQHPNIIGIISFSSGWHGHCYPICKAAPQQIGPPSSLLFHFGPAPLIIFNPNKMFFSAPFAPLR
jgi:hypothetical protein